jgi:hypothetical protein
MAKQARHVHLQSATGEIRTAQYDGRDHIVVPVVALLEGVIHAINSSTPEFVPFSSLCVAPQGWNGRPVVLDHPAENGHQVSANSPRILEARCFGNVFNAKISGKKLCLEAWIDPIKATKVGADRVLAQMRAGKMVEVSVGVYVTIDDTTGVFDGKPFKNTWAEIVPDHLAILSAGDTGACSIEMGCGAPRAAMMHKIDGNRITFLGGMKTAGAFPENAHVVIERNRKIFREQGASGAMKKLQKKQRSAIGDGSNQYGSKGSGGGKNNWDRLQSKVKNNYSSSAPSLTGGVMPKETARERRGVEPTAKDSKRISDIVTKSNGDPVKAHKIANQMADAIKEPAKAKRRAYAADDLGHTSVANIFHQRYKELTRRAASQTLKDSFKALIDSTRSLIGDGSNQYGSKGSGSIGGKATSSSVSGKTSGGKATSNNVAGWKYGGIAPKSVSKEKQGNGTRHWFNSKSDADAFKAEKGSKGHKIITGDDSSNADLGGPVHSVWVGPKGKASSETKSYLSGIDTGSEYSRFMQRRPAVVSQRVLDALKKTMSGVL